MKATTTTVMVLTLFGMNDTKPPDINDHNYITERTSIRYQISENNNRLIDEKFIEGDWRNVIIDIKIPPFPINLSAPSLKHFYFDDR